MFSSVWARVARLWPEIRADAFIGGVALLARTAAVIWAGDRFPPTADGVYYHTIASRIAAGLGSTWLWPDGKVTYAAHYPVGYPAILALVYEWTGPSVVAAGCINAVIGSAGALAAHRLAKQATSPRWALAAGLAVALHPALVMYTPAVMTEGVTASLIALAAWAASFKSRRGVIVLGLLIGVATLVRPQSLLLAPGFGLLAALRGASVALRLKRALIATALAVAVCAPWSIRNCVRMNQCALVSFNGGWNLLIGAHEHATGTFAPVEVPKACRTVWDEAEKDACFGREARRTIASQPWPWLALIPAKLAATFDYSGAPGFYLHESNGAAFDLEAKRVLAVAETVYERLAYLGALCVAALARAPMRRARWVVAAVSGALLFQTHAYLAVLGLVLALLLCQKVLWEGPTLGAATLVFLVATLAMHAIFFGAGRYSMVGFPLVTAWAFAYPPLEDTRGKPAHAAPPAAANR